VWRAPLGAPVAFGDRKAGLAAADGEGMRTGSETSRNSIQPPHASYVGSRNPDSIAPTRVAKNTLAARTPPETSRKDICGNQMVIIGTICLTPQQQTRTAIRISMETATLSTRNPPLKHIPLKNISLQIVSSSTNIFLPRENEEN